MKLRNVSGVLLFIFVPLCAMDKTLLPKKQAVIFDQEAFKNQPKVPFLIDDCDKLVEHMRNPYNPQLVVEGVDKNNEALIIAEMYNHRPIITLYGNPVSLPNAIRGVSGEDTITVDANHTIKIKDRAVQVSAWVKYGYHGDIENNKKHRIVPENGVIPTCIALCPKTQGLLIGLSDGTLKIMGSNYKAQITSYQAHSHPIDAVQYINDCIFLTRSEDKNNKEVKIWDAQQPRACLENITYSQDYISSDPTKLFRGVVDGSKSKEYSLPHCWISGGSYRFTYVQALYVYLLSKTATADAKYANNDIKQLLLHSPIIRTFEPEVTTAFTRYLLPE